MHRDHIITIDIRVLNFSEDIQKIKSSALNTRIEDFENTNYRSTILIDVFRLTQDSRLDASSEKKFARTVHLL